MHNDGQNTLQHFPYERKTHCTIAPPDLTSCVLLRNRIFNCSNRPHRSCCCETGWHYSFEWGMIGTISVNGQKCHTAAALPKKRICQLEQKTKHITINKDGVLTKTKKR